jgi:hypothetical protein
MKQSTFLGSLILGSFGLFASLAPAPQASDEAGALKALAERKASVARKIADFFADPRLAEAGRNDVLSNPASEQLELWMRRSIDARHDASPGRNERLAILAEEVERTKAIEARIKTLIENERGPAKLDAFKAEFYRLDAEYRLAKEKAGK